MISEGKKTLGAVQTIVTSLQPTDRLYVYRNGTDAVINGKNVATLDENGFLPNKCLNPIVSKDFLRQTVSEMLAIADADEGDTCYVLDESVYYKLFQAPASDINNWKIISDPFTVRSVFSRPGPNIEAQHGDYTTDLVPEGEDPLRKYFTQTRFDDAFDARFPVAFDNILVDYRNQPNGLLGLDIDKVAEAADFRLSNPSQTLQTLYNSIGKANGIVPLNDLKQIDPQYLPPMPSGYTDEDARNALAAPDFDKILGIKNTAVDSASMVSNTANLYIDSSGNEYLKHKIGSTVTNRRFAMHGTDVGFSKVGVAATGGTQSVFQINSYADSLPNFSYTNNLPLLINTTIRNWQGGALTGFQDALSIFVPGFPGQSYGSVFRFRVGGYAKTDQQIRSALDIYTSYYAPTSEAEILKNHSVRFSWDGVALSARPSAPHNNALFNNSMAFYTDSTQDYYIGRVRKNNGTVVDASPMLHLKATAPTFTSAPNNAMALYKSGYGASYVNSETGGITGGRVYYLAQIKNPDGVGGNPPSYDAFPIVGVTPGHTPSDAELSTFPRASICFYTTLSGTLAAKCKSNTGAIVNVGGATFVKTTDPSMNVGAPGQLLTYLRPDGSKYALYATVKSPDGVLPDCTFKLATSI